MRMKLLAVDVDGVLADIHSVLIRKFCGDGVGIDVIKRWDFFDDLGIKDEDFWREYVNVWKEDYKQIPLVENDVLDVLKELGYRFSRVDLVTCRPKDTVQGLLKWLDYTGIRRVLYGSVVVLPKGGDKTVLEYDLFVDDNPNMALKDRERVLLFDRPWNRGVDGVKRIRKLSDLLDMVM